MKATNLRLLLLFAERASWAFGLVGLMWWTTFQVGVATSTRQELEHFAASRLVAEAVGTSDLSLWSPQRIAAWRKALLEPATAAIAVLRIPKIRLEVPVLDGTDDRTLDRAVGYIAGTAEPGAVGNLGIAGHRDGFFRGLKDIAAGDVIEIETRQRTDVYRVERTWIVDPEDVSVLDPTSTPALTLVTCYPFYFVGAAPRRFIVRAVLVTDRPVSAPTARRGVPYPQVQTTVALSHFLVVPHRN